ncbi:small nuclear ribonucleoprotein-associated protein B'-like isoform X4 [Dermochelys coriacea]|uniref:small nuclear ribonucleoprotein-associated protein B'-like isoform X4 n=1 Tax=Dermochelys coriacea TaxID=27794 RepID=UPI001CAA0B43|nr:small nuclear ribonucleoprotein-associated protein B'-like isoform X4 [Dermochelys coriacea]XP_043367776.1 small nuclear ribonucleoprotein-associated protein B'-like isoform X4 [Dermochelys coriacea]
MEEDIEMPMDRADSAIESGDMTETKSKGPRGRGKGRGGRDFGNKGQLSYVRGKMRGKTINGLIRRVIGRMSLYPDPQGRRGGRGGATFSTILTHEKNDERSFLTSTTRHGLPPPPSPPGPMGFRGRPPHPKARGMLWMPTGRFPPPRGFPSGSGVPSPPPPGQGQRWPGPPSGRHY